MDTKAKPRQRPHQLRQRQQHQQLQRPLQGQPTTTTTTTKPKQTICRACKQKLQLANNKVRRTLLAHLPSSPPTPPPPPPMTTATKATACDTAAMASSIGAGTTTVCVASPVPSPRTSTAGSSYSRTSSHSFHSTRSSSDRCDSRAGCANGVDYGATGWEQQQQYHQNGRTSFTDEAQTCYNLLLMIRTDTQALITLRNDNLAELERASSPARANVTPGTTDGAVEDEDSTRTNSDIDRSLLLAAVNEAITYATRSIAELGPFLERHRWPASSLYSPGGGGVPGGSPTNPSESTSSRMKILRGRRPKSFFPLSSASSAASTYSSTVPTSNPPTSHSRVSSSYGHPQEEETGPLSAAALFSWTLALTDLHSAILAATAQLRGFVEFGIDALGVSEEQRKKHAARKSWWEQDRGEFQNVDLIQSLMGPRRPRREIWGGGGGSKTATGGHDPENEKQETAAAAAAGEGDLMVTENQQGEKEEQEKHETPSSSSLPDGHTITQDKGKAKERDDSAIATLTPVLEVDDSRSETWASPLSAPSTIKSTIGDSSDYGLTPRPRTGRQGSLQHDSPFAVRRSVTDPLLCFPSSPAREAPVQTVEVARSETFGQGGGRGGGVGRESSEQQLPPPLSRFNRPDYSMNPRRRPTISTTMVSTTTSLTQQQQQQQTLQYAPLPALNVLQEQLSQALSGVQLASGSGSGSGLEFINDGGSSPLSKGIPHLLTTDNNTNTAQPPAPRRISSSPILLSAPVLPNRRNPNSNLNPSPTRRTTEPPPSMATTTRPASSYSPATATPATPLDPHLLALISQKALPSKTFQPVIAALDNMIEVAPPVSPLSPLDNEPGRPLLFAGQDAATITTTGLTPSNSGNFTTATTTMGDSTSLGDGREHGSASSTVNSHHRNSPSLGHLRVQPLRPQHQLIQRVSVHPVIEDGGGPPTPDFDDEDRRQSRTSAFIPSPQVLVTPAPISPFDGTEGQTHPPQPQPQPQPQPVNRIQTQTQPKTYIPFAHHDQQQQRPWSSGAAGLTTGYTTAATENVEHQPFLAYMARKQAVSAARWALDKAQNQSNLPQQQQQ